jgi:hypothetical protein
MDKARFIEIAPIYYALAIAAYLRERPNATSRIDISKAFTIDDEETQEIWCYLDSNKLFSLGTEWLKAEKVIEIITGDFGPPLIEPSIDFDKQTERLANQTPSPFNQFARHKFSMPWLHETLRDMKRTQNSLRVTDRDFDVLDTEWRPLRLDREEPELQQVIASLDEAIEVTRGDNGYAQNIPEERAYVLDSLSALSKRLKDAATISMPYIQRYGIEPLSILARRFAKSALELTISAAKEAIKTWLQNHGLSWLDYL